VSLVHEKVIVMSTVTKNRSETQAHDAQVIVGIQKDLPAASSLPLAGTTYTPATLMQLIQSRIDLANSVANTRAAWLDTVAKYKALNAHVTQVVQGLRHYVVNAFGPSSPLLADFGFTAPKKPTLTPEQKVARAKKAAATRAARGTMGKVAKKAVKGSVQVTVTTTPTKVVPVTAATAPATSPAANGAAPSGSPAAAGGAPAAGSTTPAGGAPPANGSGSGGAHS
jgi:hypothetical protein